MDDESSKRVQAIDELAILARTSKAETEKSRRIFTKGKISCFCKLETPNKGLQLLRNGTWTLQKSLICRFSQQVNKGLFDKN